MKRKNDVASRLSRGEYQIDVQRVAEAMLRRRGPGLLVLVSAPGQRPAAGGPQDGPGPSLSAA
jgi:hypothetical protein